MKGASHTMSAEHDTTTPNAGLRMYATHVLAGTGLHVDSFYSMMTGESEDGAAATAAQHGWDIARRAHQSARAEDEQR